MIAGIVLAVGVGLAALAWILAPLLRADATRVEASRASLGRLRELHAQKQMLLASLKDLDDDRDTNKLSDEDYAALKERLSAEAIEVLQRLDRAQAEHDREIEQERRASAPLRHPAAERSGGGP